jgi:hypothetical protein
LLQEEYPNIEVKTYQIPAQEVSQLRTVLGEYDVAFKKQEKQGAFSHVIDASKYSLCLACCFSLALYNFLSKSLTVFLGVFNGSISWQLSNAKP